MRFGEPVLRCVHSSLRKCVLEVKTGKSEKSQPARSNHAAFSFISFMFSSDEPQLPSLTQSPTSGGLYRTALPML
jgi:hypothetical protein